MKPITIFDIETAPEPEAVRRITPPFDPNEVKCGNMTDPAKIAAKKKEAEDSYWNDAYAKAALNPATARICAIGIHPADGEPIILEGLPEAEMLGRFWICFDATDDIFAHWSGNNGKGSFDPRFLIVRSWVNGVEVPESAFNSKQRTELSPTAWLDLAPLFLIGCDYNSYCSANVAARTLGLIGRDLGWATVCDKDALPVKGADFHVCLADPARHEAALGYLRNDLAIERAISDVIVKKGVAA